MSIGDLPRMMKTSAQSMAAGAVHQVACARCGQVSATTRRFCGGCGSRFWEPCLKCGEQNSIAERFCSQCGGDLKAALDEAVAALEARLARSAALEQEGKLLEAAGCLAELPPSEHSELAARIEAAVQRRTMLAEKREKVVARRTAIIEEASRLRDDRQYAAAFAALEQVPSSLRDQQMRMMLSEVGHVVEQIKQLRARLRDSAQQGDIDGAISIADRLLQLEPSAADARRLHEQLCQRREERDIALAGRLLKAAREATRANDYARAEACLAKISSVAIDKLGADERKLFEAIEERAWLARQLRTALYADKCTLSVAARLAKLQPHDEKLRQLHDEMMARLSRPNKRRVQPLYVAWSRKSDGWPLGAPVAAIDELPELDWNAECSSLKSWTTSTRRYLVAAGLALHGLGASRLDLELKRKDGAGWLNRLSEVRLRKAAPSAWGLDFGTSGLKVVRLVREKDRIAVTASDVIAYDAPMAGNGTPDLQPYFAAALQRFLERHAPGSEPLVVGFPGAQSLGRFIRLPGDAKKVQAALQFEIANQIPLPLEQVVHSHHVWEAADDDSPDMAVVLLAAKKMHVELRMGPLTESAARVASLQSECVALVNLMSHCCKQELEALARVDALVWVEVGDAATNIVAISPHKGPWFRTVYRGVRSLNAHLVSAFGITWRQADTLRADWSTARSLAAVDKALAPGLEQLTRDVRQALTISSQALGCRIRSIRVAGGGCQQFGLLRNWTWAGEHHSATGLANEAVAAAGVDEPLEE